MVNVCVYLHVHACRCESSENSPTKNEEIAEVEEYFRAKDMRCNKKLWSPNNRELLTTECSLY